MTTFSINNQKISRGASGEPLKEPTKTCEVTKVMLKNLIVYEQLPMQYIYDQVTQSPLPHAQESDEIKLINKAFWSHELIISILVKVEKPDYSDLLENALHALKIIKELGEMADEIKAKLNQIAALCLYKINGKTETILDHINILRSLHEYLNIGEYTEALLISSSIFLSQKKYELALDDATSALRALDMLNNVEASEEDSESYSEGELTEATSLFISDSSRSELSVSLTPSSISKYKEPRLSLGSRLFQKELPEEIVEGKLKAKFRYIAILCLSELDSSPNQLATHLGAALSLDRYFDRNENAKIASITSGSCFRAGDYRTAFHAAMVGIGFNPDLELLSILEKMKDTARKHFNIAKNLDLSKKELGNKDYEKAEKYALRGLSSLNKELQIHQAFAPQFLLCLAKAQIGRKNYISGEEATRNGLELMLTTGITSSALLTTKDLLAELYFYFSYCLFVGGKKHEAAKAFTQGLRFGKVPKALESIREEMKKNHGLNSTLTEAKRSSFRKFFSK